MLGAALRGMRRALELGELARGKNVERLTAGGFTSQQIPRPTADLEKYVPTLVWTRKTARGRHSAERVDYAEDGQCDVEVRFRNHPAFDTVHWHFYPKEGDRAGGEIVFNLHGFREHRARSPTIYLPALDKIRIPGFETRVDRTFPGGPGVVIEKDGQPVGRFICGIVPVAPRRPVGYALSLRLDHAHAVLGAMDFATPKPRALPGPRAQRPPRPKGE